MTTHDLVELIFKIGTLIYMIVTTNSIHKISKWIKAQQDHNQAQNNVVKSHEDAIKVMLKAINGK